MKKLTKIICLVSLLILSFTLTTQASIPDQSNKGPYTGVIVDARGLELQTTFSPAIYDQTGRAIYGTTAIDSKFATEYGMVEYAPDLECIKTAESGHSRAGSFPIIVKAVALKGSNQNVVISTEDAEKILAANQSSNFLKNCAVVFYK